MRSAAARLLFVASGFPLAAGLATGAEPIGTAFTYQGQLKEGGVPANGQYDFVFRLFDAASGPAQVGSDVPVNHWTVSNGLFTVELDFGVDALNGDARWLEIAVGPPGGPLTTLAPRHKVTATPYAVQVRGMFVDENLNVGIGTDTPEGVLDVRGPNGGDIHLGVNDAGARIITTDAAGNLNLRPRVDGAGVFVRDGNTNKGIQLYGGGMNVMQSVDLDGTSPFALSINPDGGNVGIGTSAPGAKLDVGAGDIHLDANRELFFSDNGQIRSLDDKHRVLFRRDENKLELREYGDIILSAGATAGDETGSVIVKSSGNIGIGTATPDAKLDLNGEMIHRGGALKHYGHDLVIAHAARGDGGRALVHEGDGVNERLVLNFSNDFNQGTVVHGNLGLGRTPSAKLDVAGGDIKVDMDMRLKFDAEDGRTFDLGYDSATDSGVITAAGRNLELNTGWGESLTLRAGHGGIRFNIQTDAGNDATKMELTSAGDLEVEGDLVVSGAVRGNLGPHSGAPFPRPAYDSGWQDVTAGEQLTLEHAIGGDADNYVVDLQCSIWWAPGTWSAEGIEWRELTATQIKIRPSSDTICTYVRVRIWTYN